MGKRRLLWFCVAFVATAMLAALCETALGFLCIWLCVIAIAVVVLCSTNNRISACLVIAAAALALVWQSVHLVIDELPREFFAQTDGISAEVISYTEPTPAGGKSFRARIEDEGRSINAIVYADGSCPEVAPGDIVLMNAKLYEFENTEFFAEKTYYKSRYIDISAYASDVEITKKSEGVNLRYLPEYLAKMFKDKADEIYDSDTSGFVKSLILGDRSGISDDFYGDLKIVGMSHAISVSGMHISFILGLFLYFSKNKYLKLAAIPLIFLFVLMVGAPQSVLRAVIMQVFVIASSFSKREYDQLTALAASAFILVAVNSYCATDIAFLLSFFATLGIIVLHPKVCGFLERFSIKRKSFARKLSLGLLSTVSMSVSASVFTAALSAYSFGYISLIGPFVNAVLNGFLSAAFSAGFINTILAFLIPPIAKVGAYIINLLVGVIMSVINALASLPFAAVFTGSPIIIMLICFICVVLVYAISVGCKKMRVVFPVCAIAAAVLSVFAASTLGTPKLSAGEGIRFDVLNVGQGQCIIATSGEMCAVIDCGGDEDAGNIAISHLVESGVTDIDAMVLTHAHADHANGAERLMNGIPTKAVYMPATDKNNATFLRLAENADENCETVLVEKDMTVELDGMKIKLLTLPPGNDENENGIVIIVSDGEYDALITGDIATSNEKLVLDRLPDCESYIVGHHGSKSSSSQALLNKALPELAVISVGIGNTYGHPSSQALSRLENIGAVVKRTDMDGTLTFYSRNREANAA